MIIRSADELERLQADGKITVTDADEVRRFADFLSEAGPPCEDPHGRIHAAMHRFYPEDLRRARIDVGLPPDCCTEGARS